MLLNNFIYLLGRMVNKNAKSVNNSSDYMVNLMNCANSTSYKVYSEISIPSNPNNLPYGGICIGSGTTPPPN